MSNHDYYGFKKEKITQKDGVNATERSETSQEIANLKNTIQDMAAKISMLEDKYDALLIEVRKLALK